MSQETIFNNGWIQLHRSIHKHWIWKDANKLKWWLDILLTVNHSDAKVLIGNSLIDCKRGQSINSLDTWAKRWGVSKSKVRRFLILLQNDSMIVSESVQKSTRLTVCKYDSYQGLRNDNETIMKQQRNDSETQTAPNNNDKEEKNKDKEVSTHPFIDYIKINCPNVAKMKSMLTIEEADRLVEGFDKSILADIVNSMDNYADLNKKYVSTNKTIRSWIKLRKEKNPIATSAIRPNMDGLTLN